MTEDARLIDIAVALGKRGREEEADYYGEAFPTLMSLIYDVPIDEILQMTPEDISKLELPPEKPLKYEGWNFWHGRAAFGNHS
jgi:hypothetical protein